MRTEARFPSLATGTGHYESFYAKAVAPAGGRAVWIRHTLHRPPGSEPTGAVWLTYFDAEADRPQAAKATYGGERLTVPEGQYIQVADAAIGPDGLTGRVTTDGLEAEWELSFEDRHEAFRHLPSERMYRAKLPRTKLLSPHPAAIFSGSLTIDGERLELDSWPGMVGHNWGTEHAERWIWMHAVDLEGGEPGDYFDVGAGRIKLGPLSTPWIANGALALGGQVYRLGGLGRTYGTEIHERPDGCEFVIAGKGITVRGGVNSATGQTVGWLYADPDGGEHHAVHCSIADMELRVERPSHRHAHLRVTGAASYELGMRETDHGIPIQDFPDGRS